MKPDRKTFTKPEQQKSKTTKKRITKERDQDERDWIKEEMLSEEENISPDDLNLFTLVDTSDEAVENIVKFYSRYLLSPNF